MGARTSEQAGDVGASRGKEGNHKGCPYRNYRGSFGGVTETLPIFLAPCDGGLYDGRSDGPLPGQNARTAAEEDRAGRLFCRGCGSKACREPMNAIRYEAPRSVDDAVALLATANGGGRVLAGGTDLLVQMHAGVVRPGLIVDVKKIREMRRITQENGAFRVGAAVSGAEMGEHAALKAAWPGVVEAVELIGSTQIQSRATPGGNLCNASPAADSVPALVAAGAVCTVAGPGGRRELAAEEVCTGPGSTALRTGEVVVDFRLPASAEGTGDAYLRMIPRTEMDIAIVGAGVCLKVDGAGTITRARVSLGAVAPTVLLVGPAGAALVGTSLGDDALAALDRAARDACNPIDDKRGTVDYRIKVAGVLARRAAAIAYERARSE